ncbi:hypothetical protein [Metapseudomonas otitidis]|uniref:hypothetical protein n=1 Tax=Metapseudomonas otitidis TaxID=319939 RepID=UPI0015FFCCB6|nr:hypothetical protein [Pseudomonas otitidis]
MDDFFEAFGNLGESVVTLEPATHGVFRVRREKNYPNLSGYFDNPQTAQLLANLRMPGNAQALMTENGQQTPLSQREGLAAIAAMRAGAVPGPISRGEGPIDFVDAMGMPFDVKTPKPGYSMVDAAEAIIHEMEGSQAKNGLESYKSRVVMDTTFLSSGERGALWGALSNYASNRRLIEVFLPYNKKARILHFA